MQLTPIPRRRRLIGLTPLIDVVFILLLFFLLASRFHQWRALTIDTAASPGEHGAAPSVLVRIRDDGRLDLSGEPITSPVLIARLRLMLAREPHLSVQIESADALPLQSLVTLLDQIREAGIDRMSLR